MEKNPGFSKNILLQLTDKNGFRFSDNVYPKIYRCMHYLIQPDTT